MRSLCAAGRDLLPQSLETKHMLLPQAGCEEGDQKVGLLSIPFLVSSSRLYVIFA